MALRERLYAWWWWRSPNKPRITDRTYIDLLDSLPATARGLDVGSRQRIRRNAITLDVVEAKGVDVVGDAHDLPFPDFSFDYVWCNAVLEHLRDPRQAANELIRVLKPGGVAFVQVPFLEYVHGWPDDYYRFTLNGLRELFRGLEEVAAGASAGPGQVLPDLVQYYATGFSDIQSRRFWPTFCAAVVGVLLLPVRFLDRALRKRPSYWQWARAYYYVGRRPLTIPRTTDRSTGELRPIAGVVSPDVATSGWDVIMGLRTKELINALRTVGADVTSANAGRDIPVDFVVAPNLNYFLFAEFDRGQWTPRRMLPTHMLWDDPLGALALKSLSDRGGTLGSEGPRESNILEKFRAVMSGPAVRHYAWDSGHVEAVTDLALADPQSITWYAIATFRPFLEQGRRNDTEEARDLAFCGNVYANARGASSFADDPWFVELTRKICDGKVANLAKSSWELMNGALEEVSARERAARGLVPDETPFWDYYLYVAWYSVTTAARVELLSAVDRNVHLFGMFADPASVKLLERRPNLVYAGDAHHFRELPHTFASTKINVCIANGLIHRGAPSKLIDCLASGGFAISDPKDDLVRLFGRDIEAIFFRNADDLNAKVEYFLPRRDERREIVHELRKTIERECTPERLFERVLATHREACT
jgi:SAM-dependent methyltransferase